MTSKERLLRQNTPRSVASAELLKPFSLPPPVDAGQAPHPKSAIFPGLLRPIAIPAFMHNCSLVQETILAPLEMRQDVSTNPFIGPRKAHGLGDRQTRIVQIVRDSANLTHRESDSHRSIRPSLHQPNHHRFDENNQASLQDLKMIPDPQVRAEAILREQALGRSFSKAIAIQRPSKTAKEAESVDMSASVYDWATWRMYNRIVSHREKNPIREPPPHSREQDTPLQQPIGSVRAKRALPSPPASGRVTPLLQDEEYLDGEVFDIEI